MFCTASGAIRAKNGGFSCRWPTIGLLASAYFQAKFFSKSAQGYGVAVAVELARVSKCHIALLALAKDIIDNFLDESDKQ